MSPCPLDACHVCTGCAHHRHDTCRQTVRCPNTQQLNPCRCCGPNRRSAP